ncbi:hypothetical protein K435DRAFT_127360 [Dendrothele bispora CBS 962.96]|uniref:Uncharacterized protein n=1 Tax=Dendrothele bispora (strain CBS 962.96) TaxID=1314807 RepID=A0A4S8KMP8_DENBC|nr:hypothetical protein K435DRAFT_127360 [Dendrothele bispora CBS 962.96]
MTRKRSNLSPDELEDQTLADLLARKILKKRKRLESGKWFIDCCDEATKSDNWPISAQIRYLHDHSERLSTLPPPPPPTGSGRRAKRRYKPWRLRLELNHLLVNLNAKRPERPLLHVPVLGRLRTRFKLEAPCSGPCSWIQSMNGMILKDGM